MVSQEVLRKIKEIEIIARRLVSSQTIGAASSAQKGTGFEFDQLRDYQPGDDVRTIDWNSSARTQKLLVKQYIEERSRTIYIVMDISASMVFSSQEKSKNDIAHQIASLIALVGNYGKDKIGLILCGRIVELHRPAKAGRAYVWQIISDIFTTAATSKESNLEQALALLNRIKEKNMIVFIISDFIQTNTQQILKSSSLKHDLIAIRILDEQEIEVPDCGMFYAVDIESGLTSIIDSRYQKITGLLTSRIRHQDHLFKKTSLRLITVNPGPQALNHVAKFFTRIMKY
jgi:uncharacterized protein (DUF58 family)